MTTSDTLLSSDRTEDLTGDQVLSLFAGAVDETIAGSLVTPGTHLIQGSRGTGKTMLLRVAYERLDRQRPDVLPVFVRFSKYLATYNAAARRVPGYSAFQSWVFAILLKGMADAFARRSAGAPVPAVSALPLEKYITILESHYDNSAVADPANNAAQLGVQAADLLEFARLDRVQERVLAVLNQFKLQNVAFFMDEAAQSFAEDLQPEFFELIKHLRHHRVWVKAAVYPHTTNYGADFDVGQDAILLPIERPIESKEGMDFFDDFIRKRYTGTAIGAAFDRSDTPKRFLIKMSGGNPRWFIHLVSKVAVTRGGAIQANDVVAVAKELPETTLWPYLDNLRRRLASKRRYFDSAMQLGQVLVEGLREVNGRLKRESPDRPSVFVAISTHKTVPFRVHEAMRLLQYAGILLPRGFKKISPRETAEMFLLHPAIQFRENTLFVQEANPAIESVVSALTDPLRDKFKEYTRNSQRLIEFGKEEEEAITCSECETALPADARFCFKCGTPVAAESPFQELLAAPTSELELTPGIKGRVLEDGRFNTVGSILAATDVELDSIRNIGPERIKLLRYAAEEFVAG